MSPRSMSMAAAALTSLLVLPLAASTGEMAITTSSPEARQLYVQARDKANNLELQAALKLIDQAIAKDPDFAMAYMLRANASASFPVFRENLDKAVSLADRVSPGEREWILASKAQADGDMTGARSHLDTLVAQFPTDKEVLLRAARFQRMAGNDRAAVEAFRKVTVEAPSFAPAYNDLGYALVAARDFPGAEAAFKKYIALLPGSPNPYDSYAEMLMKAGRFEASIAQYRKALDKNPEFVSSLAGIGTNLMLKKDYAEARRTFEEQRTKAPDLDGQLDALENVARSYVDEGERAKAIETFDDISARAKEGGLALRAANAQLDAAFVLSQGNNPSAAMPHVERAEELIKGASLPETITSRQENRVSLARASVLSAEGQPEQAQSEVDKARAGIEQRHVPADVRRLNATMGTIALRQKRFREAVDYLKKGDDQDPFTRYQLAEAEEGLGQTRQASTMFAQVAKSNVNDLGYVLVRGEATEKASSARPVATAGRRKKQ
jgi:tetratricopeptide (TPR) repeat protein